jgi:hypothetical protein
MELYRHPLHINIIISNIGNWLHTYRAVPGCLVRLTPR